MRACFTLNSTCQLFFVKISIAEYFKQKLMKIKITFFRLLLSAFLCTLLMHKVDAQLTTFTEGFDAAPPTNWFVINNSKPVGETSWYQGELNQGATMTFPAQSGPKTSYIAANYSNVNTKGTISDWLITPTIIIQNGATLSFWTRTVTNSAFPDRLEVRLDTRDTSTNVGTSATSVGSYKDSLLSVNPNLIVGGYPDTGWTNYTITISGINGIDTGRIAFRYFVTDGGLEGTNSNYIGIDNVVYNAGALPVTFLGFAGVLQNNIAVLKWSTTDEINNKGFDIEKSADGQTFANIGFVAGDGNTSGINNYNFSDPKVISGDNYYRLKQIDLDGNFMYSSIIKLEFSNFGWSILGNPSSNTSVQLQLDKQYDVALQVISISGAVIQTINKGNLGQGTYSIPIDLNHETSGIYIVRLMVNGQSYSKKIIK
jgi:hypothetical protein